MLENYFWGVKHDREHHTIFRYHISSFARELRDIISWWIIENCIVSWGEQVIL